MPVPSSAGFPSGKHTEKKAAHHNKYKHHVTNDNMYFASFASIAKFTTLITISFNSQISLNNF